MIAHSAAVVHGQSWKQVSELLLAFALSSIVGLERHLRGKSAGIRTQALVGTASALFLQIGKYGFGDLVAAGAPVPLGGDRVAAQVVSGIGFLGAGLIITRQGTVRGLTTAAAVWECAAIGMAAGAGLPLLAGVATVLHFVTVLGYTYLIRYLPGADSDAEFTITYLDGRGVLRDLLTTCTGRSWSIRSLAIASVPTGNPPRGAEPGGPSEAVVTVALRLSGQDVDESAVATLGGVDGVLSIGKVDDDED